MSSTASTPTDRAVSSHSVPVSSVGESPAARNRRHNASAGNACPGSGPATTATRMRLPCHSRLNYAGHDGSACAGDHGFDNASVVETFLYALQDKDFDTVESVMADDIVWRERRLHAHARTRSASSVCSARQGTGGLRGEVPPDRRRGQRGADRANRRAGARARCGCSSGCAGCSRCTAVKITLWRDYFDLYDVVKGTVRGLVGAVVPSLRPKM